MVARTCTSSPPPSQAPEPEPLSITVAPSCIVGRRRKYRGGTEKPGQNVYVDQRRQVHYQNIPTDHVTLLRADGRLRSNAKPCSADSFAQLKQIAYKSDQHLRRPRNDTILERLAISGDSAGDQLLDTIGNDDIEPEFKNYV